MTTKRKTKTVKRTTKKVPAPRKSAAPIPDPNVRYPVYIATVLSARRLLARVADAYDASAIRMPFPGLSEAVAELDGYTALAARAHAALLKAREKGSAATGRKRKPGHTFDFDWWG